VRACVLCVLCISVGRLARACVGHAAAAAAAGGCAADSPVRRRAPSGECAMPNRARLFSARTRRTPPPALGAAHARTHSCTHARTHAAHLESRHAISSRRPPSQPRCALTKSRATNGAPATARPSAPPAPAGSSRRRTRGLLAGGRGQPDRGRGRADRPNGTVAKGQLRPVRRRGARGAGTRKGEGLCGWRRGVRGAGSGGRIRNR
jgi:hypothetical protein